MLRPGQDPKRLRTKLAERSSMPEVPDLYMLLSEAERYAGKIIEQPWFRMETFQTFSLTVEYEPLQKTAVWTLCEALDDSYRLLWTCRDTDMYLLHDILSMFMAQAEARAQPGKRSSSAAGFSKAKTVASGSPAENTESRYTGSQAAGSSFLAGEPAESQSRQSSEIKDHAVQGGGSEISGGMGLLEIGGNTGHESETEAGAIRDGRSGATTGDGIQLHAGGTLSTAGAQAEAAPEPDTAIAPASRDRQGLETEETHQTGFNRATDSQRSPVAGAFGSEEAEKRPGYFDNLLPEELDRLKDRPNLLLGRLLVESGAIPEGLLEAALKLQEMVRTESLTPTQSIDAMRRAYHRTAADEKREIKPTDSSDSSEGKLVAELLYEAGIINRDDMEAATRLKVKKGGELDILKSAGKIDARLQETALTCMRMMMRGRIRHEQGVIALNYSYRSRVDLRQTFVDLGWESCYY